MPKLHSASTVAWGLLRWDRWCMIVVRHWSNPAWQNMASLLMVVGLCTPHNMPEGGKSITYFSKNRPLKGEGSPSHDVSRDLSGNKPPLLSRLRGGGRLLSLSSMPGPNATSCYPQC